MAQDLLSDKKTNLIGADGIQPNKITTHHVFEAFEAGDPIAEKVIQRSIEFWGKASANLVSLFNPEKIIFGGGVFGPAAQFIDQIYNEAKKWAQPISIGLTKFEPSTFGHEAGLYGAGYLAMKSEESF
jgi:glucokinase